MPAEHSRDEYLDVHSVDVYEIVSVRKLSNKPSHVLVLAGGHGSKFLAVLAKARNLNANRLELGIARAGPERPLTGAGNL